MCSKLVHHLASILFVYDFATRAYNGHAIVSLAMNLTQAFNVKEKKF